MKVVLLTCDLNEESSHQTAEPFSLLYLASYAQKYLKDRVEFRVLSSSFDALKTDAEIFGITCMSRYYPRAVDVASRIKRIGKPAPVILGGSHITGLPQSLDPAFDVGVLGEGEETFLDLLKIYLEKQRYDPEDLAGVKGIVWYRDGELVINERRPLIENLDRIPPPKRELWDFSERVWWLMSSRGCPFRCVFCPTGQIRYRRFSPEYVASEILHLVRKYGTSTIGFRDDLCFADKKWTAGLKRILKEMGLLGRLVFGAALRADLIDEEIIEDLRELQVIRIAIGVESASQRILDYYKDGKVKIADVQRALDLCRQNKISVEASFILGAPMEEPEDMLETYEFIFNNFKAGKLNFVPITMLTPYPGTGLWEYACSRGLIGEAFDWTRLDMGLHNFNPYTYVYLNEKMPIEEFIDYVEIFEDIHYRTSIPYYTQQGSWHRDAIYRHRLDRELLARFREDRKKSKGERTA